MTAKEFLDYIGETWGSPTATTRTAKKRHAAYVRAYEAKRWQLVEMAADHHGNYRAILRGAMDSEIALPMVTLEDA